MKENTATKKKKLPLAMQIFIALILAVIVGLAMQKQAAFAQTTLHPSVLFS